MKRTFTLNEEVSNFLEKVENVDEFINGAILGFIDNTLVADEIAKNNKRIDKLENLVIFLIDLQRTTQRSAIAAHLHAKTLVKEVLSEEDATIADKTWYEVANDEYNEARQRYDEM